MSTIYVVVYGDSDGTECVNAWTTEADAKAWVDAVPEHGLSGCWVEPVDLDKP